MFTIILLNVGLVAVLTKIEKVLYISQAHTPPQAILSGFWPFCFFLSFLSMPCPPPPPTPAICGQLVPEWNLDMTVISQGLLLAAHLLNVSPLQLSSRKGVFSMRGVLSFLFERCILLDIFKKDFGCFLLLLGVFFLMGFTWNLKLVEAKFSIDKLLRVCNLQGKEIGVGVWTSALRTNKHL